MSGFIKEDFLDISSTAFVKLDNNSEKERSLVAKGDILITITGANVTKTGVVNFSIPEAYINQHIGLCRPVNGKTSRFLYFTIIEPSHCRKILRKEAYGAGKPGLNLGNLRSLPLPFPPLVEQQVIVENIEFVFSKIKEQKKMH